MRCSTLWLCVVPKTYKRVSTAICMGPDGSVQAWIRIYWVCTYLYLQLVWMCTSRRATVLYPHISIRNLTCSSVPFSICAHPFSTTPPKLYVQDGHYSLSKACKSLHRLSHHCIGVDHKLKVCQQNLSKVPMHVQALKVHSHKVNCMDYFEGCILDESLCCLVHMVY